MVAKTVNLRLMRGDSYTVGIQVKGLASTPTAVSFACKKAYDATEYIFQKTLSSGISQADISDGVRYAVEIAPLDTDSVKAPTRCPYDFEVIVGGRVVTVLSGKIDFLPDVTTHEAMSGRVGSGSDVEIIVEVNTDGQVCVEIADGVSQLVYVDDVVRDVADTLAPLVGSPLKASTAAGMTDTDKIYVYTGSETGYTNGNWYYYDGSAWVSGGVYNAVAVELDTELTSELKPAQGKAAGKAIRHAQEAVDAMLRDAAETVAVYKGYYRQSDGSFVTNDAYRSFRVATSSMPYIYGTDLDPIRYIFMLSGEVVGAYTPATLPDTLPAFDEVRVNYETATFETGDIAVFSSGNLRDMVQYPEKVTAEVITREGWADIGDLPANYIYQMGDDVPEDFGLAAESTNSTLVKIQAKNRADSSSWGSIYINSFGGSIYVRNKQSEWESIMVGNAMERLVAAIEYEHKGFAEPVEIRNGYYNPSNNGSFYASENYRCFAVQCSTVLPEIYGTELDPIRYVLMLDGSMVAAYKPASLPATLPTFDEVRVNYKTDTISTGDLTVYVPGESWNPSEIQDDIAQLRDDVDDLQEAAGLKGINVLFVGNSYTQDEVTYAPALVKEAFPSLKCNFGILFQGASTLNIHYNFLTGGTKYKYYYEYDWDADKWVNLGESAYSATMVLARHDWDVVVFQQGSAASYDYTTYQPYLNNLISGYVDRIGHNVRFAFLLTHAWGGNDSRIADVTSSDHMYGLISAAVQRVHNETAVSDIIPSGTALQNARTIATMDAIGDAGHMCNDASSHLQNGIPCLPPAYVVFAKVCEWMGKPYAGMLGSQIIPTQEWTVAQAIPGRNGEAEGATAENVKLSAKCAIAALKKPFVITDCSGM